MELIQLSLEIRCVSLTLRTLSTSEVTVGTTVNVSCPAGQYLPIGVDRGVMFMETICGKNGSWTPSVPYCTGKIILRYTIYIFDRLIAVALFE